MMTASALAVEQQLHVATIGRAIQRARLPKGRGVSYTNLQVAQILTHLHIASPQATPEAPNTVQADDALLARIERLEALVAHLQQENEELRAKDATHDHLLNTIIGWGKNMARVVPVLWRHSAEYQAGMTPGEIPAIQQVQIDAEGQERIDTLNAVDRETGAFFAQLDQQPTLRAALVAVTDERMRKMATYEHFWQHITNVEGSPLGRYYRDCPLRQLLWAGGVADELQTENELLKQQLAQARLELEAKPRLVVETKGEAHGIIEMLQKERDELVQRLADAKRQIKRDTLDMQAMIDTIQQRAEWQNQAQALLEEIDQIAPFGYTSI